MTLFQGDLYNPDFLSRCLAQRDPGWLVGVSHSRLLALVSQRLALLSSYQAQPLTQAQPTILLAEPDPTAFLAGFLAATAAGCPVVLGNPGWSQAEWQQVWNCITPDLIWGPTLDFPDSRLHQANQPKANQPICQPLSPGWILIPTGGSSGQLRFAIHTWETLSAAVAGFQTYFEVEQINSCCLLPLHHVSGLMQVMRSWQTGGQLVVLPFKSLIASGAEPTKHDFDPVQLALAQFNPAQFFLSLVPTQLQKLLHPDWTDWLRQFRTVFLGGAPAWDSLLNEARQQQIRLAPTYGMTETAAQIATLRPEAFLQGETSCGPTLPHARIEILPPQSSDSDESGENCALELPESNRHGQKIGQISVRASSLMLGYFPPSPHSPISPSPHSFLTDDLGYLNAQGQLQIVGRSSGKIITGGENVFPAEVEAAIRATGLVSDVCVVGLPDPIWGEAVVAVCVLQPNLTERSLNSTVTDAAMQAAVAPQLSCYKLPKRWIWVEKVPRNAQGKLNSAQIQQQVRACINSGQKPLGLSRITPASTNQIRG